jgi:hypothetical protein
MKIIKFGPNDKELHHQCSIPLSLISRTPPDQPTVYLSIVVKRAMKFEIAISVIAKFLRFLISRNCIGEFEK